MTGSAAELDDARVRREVVSFVRRSNRMRSNQRRAWETYRDRFVLDVPRRQTSTSIHPDASLDLVAAFGRDAELIVEIGPGAGESLIPMAEVRPEANVLAFEVYRPAIARMLGSLVRAGSRTYGSSRRMLLPAWSASCQLARLARSGCSFRIPGRSPAITSGDW